MHILQKQIITIIQILTITKKNSSADEKTQITDRNWSFFATFCHKISRETFQIIIWMFLEIRTKLSIDAASLESHLG